LDAAIGVGGLTREDRVQPHLKLDFAKSYEEGRADSTYGYPELPELQPDPAPVTPAQEALPQAQPGEVVFKTASPQGRFRM
jgi:hypothetical protein